jgi:hypothetical protein
MADEGSIEDSEGLVDNARRVLCIHQVTAGDSSHRMCGGSGDTRRQINTTPHTGLRVLS